MSWDTDFVRSLGGRLGLARYQGEYVKLVARLLDLGGDIQETNHQDQTPLLQALSTPEVQAPLVQLLLSRGAQVDALAKSSLVLALEHGLDETIIRMLLDAGASLDDAGECLISLAVKGGCSPSVLELLKSSMHEGQRMNIPWDTLLHQAIDKHLDGEVVCYVLAECMQINLADERGVTPLMKVSRGYYNGEVVAAFLEKGADITQRDCEGKTALMYASESDVWAGAVEVLLAAGSSATARANNSFTPLMFCMAGKEEVDFQARALVLYGSEIDARDKDGRTALRILMERKEPDYMVTRLLLEAGANPLLEDNQQVSALSLATESEKGRNLLKLLHDAAKLHRQSS